jgi:predicted RNA-binding Zn-ribbon protein involved in translation (DUF1610 family)
MKLIYEKRTRDETACPNCGALAAWGYSDSDETQVEVTCPDCGRIEMTRADFDCAEADIADPSEPDI